MIKNRTVNTRKKLEIKANGGFKNKNNSGHISHHNMKETEIISLYLHILLFFCQPSTSTTKQRSKIKYSLLLLLLLILLTVKMQFQVMCVRIMSCILLGAIKLKCSWVFLGFSLITLQFKNIELKINSLQVEVCCLVCFNSNRFNSGCIFVRFELSSSCSCFTLNDSHTYNQ